MSKGFNEQERQSIHNALIEQGRELFAKFGFQKTSILDITKSVGIAQGTFYKFFDSKDELFFIVLELEESNIKEQVLKLDVFKHHEPREAIKVILRHMVQTIEQNPLIRELYFNSNLEKISTKLSPQLLEKHFSHDSNSFLPVIEILKAAGYKIEEKPEVIAGVLRSLFLLTFHDKEIGKNVYNDTINLFINLIVDGLVKEERG